MGKVEPQLRKQGSAPCPLPSTLTGSRWPPADRRRGLHSRAVCSVTGRRRLANRMQGESRPCGVPARKAPPATRQSSKRVVPRCPGSISRVAGTSGHYGHLGPRTLKVSGRVSVSQSRIPLPHTPSEASPTLNPSETKCPHGCKTEITVVIVLHGAVVSLEGNPVSVREVPGPRFTLQR